MQIDSYSLMTDLYQLSMAYCYWKEKIQDRKSCFTLFFRKKPFGGEYAIAAGLETLIQFIQNFSYSESDLEYLSTLNGYDQKPLFEKEFIEYLKNFKFDLDIDAVKEGSVVFPKEPILRVRGPILHAQLLESPLLNIMNFQTLIATKAARICQAAQGGQVVEFGMRRAQGVDGAITASRASFIGGCSATSNVIAGKLFGIPVKGTQAHSWVMCFDDEKRAFEIFAKYMPGNCIFLIDTFNTIEGAKIAVDVAIKMKKEGKNALGVRLDSGDLASLSKQVRKLLDERGLKDLKIMASNELDEHIIYDLINQGAQIDLWGVGTALVTGKGQGAIDGVFKMTMMENDASELSYRMKVSDQISKSTTPGLLAVKRFFLNGKPIGDVIYDQSQGDEKIEEALTTVDSLSHWTIPSEATYQELLEPIFSKGKLLYKLPKLKEVQKYCQDQLSKFNPEMKRFLHPEPYFVGIEKKLHEKKLQLIKSKR